MTKGRVALPFKLDAAEDELQIPPLRYAPVGMTKGRVALPFKLDAAEDEQQIPPLRYPGFPVGLGGVVAIHAPFFTEGRIRGLV
jgi:hypothetical protein